MVIAKRKTKSKIIVICVFSLKAFDDRLEVARVYRRRGRIGGNVPGYPEQQLFSSYAASILFLSFLLLARHLEMH